MPDFLPRRESDLLMWCSAFRNGILPDPQAYALTEQQAADYAACVEAFGQAYALVMSNGTNSGSSVVAKDTAKEELLRQTRQLTRIVRVSPDVTDEQRSLVGIKPKYVGKAALLPKPKSHPVIRVDATCTHRLRIRLSDSEVGGTAKPRGVHAATIYVCYDGSPTSPSKNWTMIRQITRTDYTINLTGEIPFGQWIWVTAEWRNPRGVAGPKANAVRTRYAGSGAEIRSSIRAA